jgi:hypothetical protein
MAVRIARLPSSSHPPDWCCAHRLPTWRRTRRWPTHATSRATRC